MSIKYDKNTDTPAIILGPELYGACGYKAGDFTAFVDDADSLVKISIANASRFVARALAAEVAVAGAPAVEPPKIYHSTLEE